MSVKARGSITLIRVNDGEDGNDAITVSPTAPSNPVTGQLWQTATGNQIKRWEGIVCWYIIFVLRYDYEYVQESVENLKVDSLSAISANLGAITAGSISINDTFSVTSGGILTATSGTIGGWKIEDTKISSSDGGMSVWNEMSLTSDASLSSVQYNKVDSMQYRTKLYAGMIDIGYQAYGDIDNISLERGINISGGLLNFYNALTNSVGAIEVDNSGPSLKISASNSLEVIAKAYTFEINNKQVYMFGLQSTYDF